MPATMQQQPFCRSKPAEPLTADDHFHPLKTGAATRAACVAPHVQNQQQLLNSCLRCCCNPPVDHVLGVCMRQEAKQLLCFGSRYCLSHVPTPDDLVEQLPAIAALHYEVEVLGILEHLLQLHHVWMI